MSLWHGVVHGAHVDGHGRILGQLGGARGPGPGARDEDGLSRSGRPQSRGDHQAGDNGPLLFQKAFRDATKKKHSPYALRHTFERWAEEAGIPPSRADAYMGHEPRTVKQRYRWHEVEPYLTDDAARLREYLADANSVRMLGS